MRGHEVARAGGASTNVVTHERVLDFARGAGFATRFRGYEATELETV
ncbi:MAG: hypothetical protein H0U12_02235, partial [Thermoleophilaceae bacterium]|nr:hypothetical protein [Thermoleophilaceae bacterium]